MLLFNTLLALAWVAITGELSFLNLVAGFGIGYAVLWVVWRARGPSDYFSRVGESVRCAIHFIWELITATFRVSVDILAPEPNLTPAIIAIPVDGPGERAEPLAAEEADPAAPSAAEVTTLANLITLTPGTLCVDVSPDRRTLFVHTMHAEDVGVARHTIQEGLGKRVRRIFQ